MKITVIDAGKRFNRDWIFRHLSYEFTTGHSYAITGPNGSGKSTLLQSVAGAIGISEGAIHYSDLRPVPSDQAFRHLSLAAPYLEVIEEMTLTEFLHFHAAFKPLGCTVKEAIARIGLETAAQKQIRFYSSGMKQRVRLAQAFFSDTPVVLLDEPCTNLDVDGIGLYRQLIREHTPGRLLIISSNDVQEYDFCEETIDIRNYR
jgi:ABC-type multidrug transport system ATPase subunit